MTHRGTPVTNIYIVNDDGVFDPNALTNISQILNIDQNTLSTANIRVSSHANSQAQQQGQGGGQFFNLHNHQEERRRRRREEKERRKREEEEKKKKMDELKKKFAFLRNESLDNWRSVFTKSHKTEESCFKKTKGYESIRQTLDKHHTVVILGYPGEGKTASAKYLAEEYNSHMTMSSGPKYQILWPKSPAEFKQTVDPSKFQIIIIDDIFGTYTVNLRKVEAWQDYLDIMQIIIKSAHSKLRLVITCGRHLYDKVQQFLKGRPLFQECQIVDISSDGIGLQPKERSEILRSNAGYMSYGESSDMMAYSSYTGYPLCCRLYNTFRTFQVLGRSFFNDPSKYLPQEIEKVEHFDKTVYGLLVFVAINGGYLDVRGKQLSEMNADCLEKLKKILRALGAPVEALEMWILQEAARVLSGIFILPIEGESYRIVHHRLTEFVVRQFSFGHGEIIVELTGPNMFLEFVKSTHYSESLHERTCNVYPVQYDLLARRLVFEILQGNIRFCCQHQAFTEPRFVKHFFEYLDRLGNLEAVYRARDDKNQSLIFWAAWYGRDEIVKGFATIESLNRLADDGLGIAEQRTLALLACCYRGGITEMKPPFTRPVKNAEPPPPRPAEAVRALLEAGVQVTTTTTLENAEELLCLEFAFLMNNSAMPIHYTALGCSGDAMKAVLQKGADVNSVTDLGETALHLAASRKDPDVVKNLLENGANVNAKTELGKLPLHDAVFYGHRDVASLLIEGGADLHVPADDGRPILQVAVANTDFEMVKLLIEKGFDANTKGRDGWTALHEAFYLGDTQSAEYLIEKGANAYCSTYGGVQPLHEAVQTSDTDLIDLLLESGLSVNNSGTNGETPLHIAAKNGNMELVRKLVDMGASISARDYNGQMAMNHAASQGHSDVMEYLMQRSGMRVPSRRDPYNELLDDEGPYGGLPMPLRYRMLNRKGY